MSLENQPRWRHVVECKRSIDIKVLNSLQAKLGPKYESSWSNKGHISPLNMFVGAH